MPFETFDEGIEPGGLRDKDQIKLLICYILSKVNTCLTTEDVLNVLQVNGIANYFEAADAFADLIKKNHLQAESGQEPICYGVTESGRTISRHLENELPQAIKDHTTAAVLMLLEQKRKEKENSVDIIKTENGYNVTCTISDGTIDLYKFSIYVPEQNQANTIKRNFYKNPEIIYQSTIAMLTGNQEFIIGVLEDIKEENKPNTL